MFWNKYLLPMLVALVTVASLNWIGTVENYYYTTNWFDWPVHFFGGVWVALFVLWFLNLPRIEAVKSLLNGKTLIFAVFCVGIAWEIYELSFGITNFHDKGYAFDTAHDLLNDVLGACLVAYLTRKSITKTQV
ncbi:MAG TPA: hypothetical protein VFT82_01310 [Candidatus Paceibacterota bacterium]|nr:hypothetical protein [Candidatus Paceibacterota bacterium]